MGRQGNIMPYVVRLSPARFEHLLAGVVLWVVCLWWHQRRGEKTLLHPVAVLLAMPGLYLGTALSDWDIWLLGIGGHRNPLFHSALPYFVLAWVWRTVGIEAMIQRLGGVRLNLAVHVGFSVGLASHMLLDIWQYGDVRWIPGGTLDRLWLGGHAALLGGVACFPRVLLGGSSLPPRVT